MQDRSHSKMFSTYPNVPQCYVVGNHLRSILMRDASLSHLSLLLDVRAAWWWCSRLSLHSHFFLRIRQCPVANIIGNDSERDNGKDGRWKRNKCTNGGSNIFVRSLLSLFCLPLDEHVSLSFSARDTFHILSFFLVVLISLVFLSQSRDACTLSLFPFLTLLDVEEIVSKRTEMMMTMMILWLFLCLTLSCSLGQKQKQIQRQPINETTTTKTAVSMCLTRHRIKMCVLLFLLSWDRIKRNSRKRFYTNIQRKLFVVSFSMLQINKEEASPSWKLITLSCFLRKSYFQSAFFPFMSQIPFDPGFLSSLLQNSSFLSSCQMGSSFSIFGKQLQTKTFLLIKGTKKYSPKRIQHAKNYIILSWVSTTRMTMTMISQDGTSHRNLIVGMSWFLSCLAFDLNQYLFYTISWKGRLMIPQRKKVSFSFTGRIFLWQKVSKKSVPLNVLLQGSSLRRQM